MAALSGVGGSVVGVAGVGACTAIGRAAPATAAAVRAGIAGLGEHPCMVDQAGQKMIVARAPYLDIGMSGRDRLLALALAAAEEALAVLEGQFGRLPAIPCFFGLPAARPGLSDGLARELADQLGAALRAYRPVGRVEAIPNGHSAGLMALERGWRSILDGGAEICLVGGADTYLEPETLEWLEDCEQLHRAGVTNNAWGFIPGEAAGFCLLAARGAVERHRLTCPCRVLAVATAHETNLIKTETVCIGKGLSEAVRNALAALPPATRVDQVVCDMNGEPYRADEYGFTIARTSERFVDAADFLAPADCWGDVGAASGVLYLTLADAAGRRGYSKGPHWLAWTSSESGERSAALLHVNNTPKEETH